jgi:hypothetical protein
MPPFARLSHVWLAAAAISALVAQAAVAHAVTSKTISCILREPLPSEDISLTADDGQLAIQGPTYVYTVSKANGAITSLRAVREGQIVVESLGPADLTIDDYRLASEKTAARIEIVEQGKQKIALKVDGVLKDAKGQGPDLPFRLAHTFYNDGVAVTTVTLLPKADLAVRRSISHRLAAVGRFRDYLHKDQQHYDSDTPGRDTPLPAPGQAARFTTQTSCLEVFSPQAALAIFTDMGAMHLGDKGLETALLEVGPPQSGAASVALAQHIVQVGPNGEPYLLKAGSEMSFRVGVAVAPNRLPHPRWRDLRMFVWIGDQKHPYPSDDEIRQVARLGYTVLQLHRGGTPGEPRPPQKELDRVVQTVHDAGMLLVWTLVGDLSYVHAPAVEKMRAGDNWILWEGVPGSRYKPSMDSFCDLVGTCTANPNGLADYRLACDAKMLRMHPVDGMYVDNNFAVAGCPHWKAHGHPRRAYDCLIEIHEMNWRRRQLFREHCPHAVLIDHCGRGIALPVICDFDIHIYGEGRSFGSLESYWGFFNSFKALWGQSSLWAGDSEDVRCPTEVAFHYDLLTGGGQYCYLDWRFWPDKLPYAKGVSKAEPLLVKTYNLAQYYFGMYESEPHYFAESADLFAATAPRTYATIYQNRLWNDLLIPLANMSPKEQKTSLVIRSPGKLGLSADGQYTLYDVNARTSQRVKGGQLDRALGDLVMPGRSLKLFYLRPEPAGPYHLWGGKRILETRDAASGQLTVELHGPVGLEDTVLIAGIDRPVEHVAVDGRKAKFSFDPARRIAHGKITFGPKPVKLELVPSSTGKSALPEKTVPADELTLKYERHRGG